MIQSLPIIILIGSGSFPRPMPLGSHQ